MDIMKIIKAMKYVGCESMVHEVQYVIETCDNGLCQNHYVNGDQDLNSCCVCAERRLEFGDY